MNEIILSYLTIVVVALITGFLRAVPFLLFSGNKKIPGSILYLGKVLPPTIMVILVIYSLRNIDYTKSPYGLPEMTAVLVTVILQHLKKNTMLSMMIGTAVYMLMLRLM